MPEHIKIIIAPQPISAAALTLLQLELGTPLSVLQSRIADGTPILDETPRHHAVDDFLKSTARLVHTLDNLGVEYRAWINDQSVTPVHLRGVLSRQHRIQQKLHPHEGHSHPDLGDD